MLYMMYMQCNGKDISWKHLEELYLLDTTSGNGLRLVPKLKYEHIHLTTFSKMHVDLAAQVTIREVLCICTLHTCVITSVLVHSF